MGMGELDMEMGNSSDDEPNEPPPQSADPAIQWIIDNMVLKRDMKRTEDRLNRKMKSLEKNVKDLMDEGDPWIRELHAYLNGVYSRYFGVKASKHKC